MIKYDWEENGKIKIAHLKFLKAVEPCYWMYSVKTRTVREKYEKGIDPGNYPNINFSTKSFPKLVFFNSVVKDQYGALKCKHFIFTEHLLIKYAFRKIKQQLKIIYRISIFNSDKDVSMALKLITVFFKTNLILSLCIQWGENNTF